MVRSVQQLRSDAMQIWRAGLEAVRSDRLVRDTVRVEGSTLIVDDLEIDLRNVGRIAVVGAGKAGAGMARGLEEALGPRLVDEKRLIGWVNVPGDCATEGGRIHLHPARPAGRNEPTEDGVRGTDEILRIVGALGPADLCLCLISGGGSALLPAPATGISLEDKLAITRHLSAAGANIQQLNTVRKQLSRVKGGGLARACRAGQLISLIISDVIGDPLDMIASGPTVEDRSTPAEAREILQHFNAAEAGVSLAVLEYLERKQSGSALAPTCEVHNIIIGNNAVAVDAAGLQAEKLGYSHAMFGARPDEGQVEETGRHLARVAIQMRGQKGPDCLIVGGEGVVTLADAAKRGLGGRNQQLVLAALDELVRNDARGVLVLSGGTDGEDGPTDAAGAWVDDELIAAARNVSLDARDYLRRSDAYHFFEPLGALIKTGPTHTNVCDLRVVLVDRVELQHGAR